MRLLASSPVGSLTDVPGLKVGHFTDPRRPTGCTVVIAERGAVCGGDVRGGAPGTRETDLLDPRHTVGVAHAVVLAGGSAFGLDAAGGVMRWLEERGVGFEVRGLRVPIVPAAILFDLHVGDGRIRPDAAAGHAACVAAGSGPVAEGSVGAGAGATVGKLFGPARAMKGGIGSASIRRPDGVVVAALVAVNAFGDVVDPASGRVVAGGRAADGVSLSPMLPQLRSGPWPPVADPGNTTIGVVATNVALTKAEASKVAQMAHDGLARTIVPVHTPVDGDTLFTLATGELAVADPAFLVGSLAAEVVAEAVLRAVRLARGWPTCPSAEELAFQRQPAVSVAAGAALLRDWRPEDAEAIAPLANDREVWRNLRDVFPHPYGVEDARSFIAMARAMTPRTLFAIEVDGRAAGAIGYTLHGDVERVGAEMGYWLGRPYHGRGIVTEAVRALTAYAFAQHPELQRIYAVPFAWNGASARVLEKAGFTLEGTLRRSALKDGHLVDQLMYARLR
jgi:L-aminopeptidase/D-esterase-like protein/RimJ/RimL family protein N-acetyltransferase